MKITKIKIKNYRSCIDTTFEPHESLSALVGPNGSGKTTILSAFKLISAVLNTRPRPHRTPLTSASISQIRVWLLIDSKTIIYTANINLVNNEKNQDEIVSAEERWYLYSITNSRAQIDIPSWVLRDTSDSREMRHAEPLLRYLEQFGLGAHNIDILVNAVQLLAHINYYSASQFTNPGSSPISFEVEGDEQRRVGISILGHKKFLYELYQSYRSENDSFKEYMALVGPDGIGLVESLKFEEVITSTAKVSVMAGGKVVKRDRQNLLVIPSFAIAGNQLSPSQLSEGTFKTLALIFYLVTDKSPIVMIEEPEVCVHLGLLSSIMELIQTYSKTKQILISTHSDAVLDCLSIENVFRVTRTTKSGTVVSSIRRRMKAKELSALKDYLRNEGSLGEYWKHGDLENV